MVHVSRHSCRSTRCIAAGVLLVLGLSAGRHVPCAKAADPASPASSPTLLTRQNAVNIFLNSLDPFDPDTATAAAYFFRQSQPDSVLPPFVTVSDFDSSFVYQSPNPSYFFWIDWQTQCFWGHRAGYTSVDAVNGNVQSFEALSWPVINGVPDYQYLDLASFHPDLLFGGTFYPAIGVVPGFTPQPNPASTEWAIVIAGRNTHLDPASTPDAPAIKGDVVRALNYLNQQNGGPKLPPGNITVVGIDAGDPNNTGATRDEMKAAIKNLPKNCDKLYVFYYGHGQERVANREAKLFVKGTGGNRTASVTYAEFRDWLLCAEAKEYCILMMDCFSGSAIPPFSRRVGGKQLKGMVFTSSSPTQPTDREADGSTFMKALSL